MTLVTSGLMAIVVTAALTQSAAAAGPWSDFGGGRFEIQAQRQQRGEAQRQSLRNVRRGERPPERDKRGDGRLTEEERRRLHLDLDRANREIYKGR